MGARLHMLLASLLLAPACASEGSEAVQAELTRASSLATDGLVIIEQALALSELRGLGEGVSRVEQATRSLAALENDERASGPQQLMAVLLQARAWDDTVRAIEGAGVPGGMDASQSELYRGMLRDKAFPSRIAAQNSWARARKVACRLGADDSVLLEILDGVSRYGGRAGNVEEACREP